MKLEPKLPNGRDRCQARLVQLPVFQCANAAKPGEAFCTTHLRVIAKRAAEAEELERRE